MTLTIGASLKTEILTEKPTESIIEQQEIQEQKIEIDNESKDLLETETLPVTSDLED